jgi:hypothetical protein
LVEEEVQGNTFITNTSRRKTHAAVVVSSFKTRDRYTNEEIKELVRKDTKVIDPW